MNACSRLRCAAAVILTCGPLAAQTDLWQLDGTAVGLPDELGFAVAGVGNYACVGAPFGQNQFLAADTGVIWGVRWSRAGGRTMVWPFPNTGNGQPNAEFGASIAALGTTHMVVGAPVKVTTPLGPTGAALLMTAAGAVANQVNGTGSGHRAGDRVSSAGDVDADGTEDFLVWAPHANRCGISFGSQILVALSNFGAPALSAINGCVGVPPSAPFVGAAMSALENVGGASGDEFLVSTQNPNQVVVYTWNAGNTALAVLRTDPAPTAVRALVHLHGLTGAGSLHYARGLLGDVVEIVDGSTGAVWRALRADTSQGIADFGASLADVGDQDGDGADDLLVGAPTTANGDGAAFLYSGATQELLRVFRPRAAAGHFGYALAEIADQTGDGVPEILIGAPATNQDAGRALLFSLDPILPDSALYGQGCTPPGAGVPLPLIGTPAGPPCVGSKFHVNVTRAPVGQPAILFLAFTQFRPPVNLTAACQPGCLLYPNAIATGSTFARPLRSTTSSSATGQGFAEVALRLPTTPGLAGVQLFAQWFVFSPLTGSCPGTLSQPVQLTVRPPC